VFAAQNKQVDSEILGTAALRMQDLCDVVPLLSQTLQFQDHIDAGQAAARKNEESKEGNCLSVLAVRVWRGRASS
jgi:hypothetical protein